jgi:hypothetical protein
LREEALAAGTYFEARRAEIYPPVVSPYNTNLDGEEGCHLEDDIDEWLPAFLTFFRKLVMIPERAETSQASFSRLKRQLSLWNDTLKAEFDGHVDRILNVHAGRVAGDNELLATERNDLNQITEADERYFQWYLKQSKAAISVYRGDGRDINATSLDNFRFAHVLPGGTRDISFRGVVEHTHSNSFKNGMVSTTSDFNGAHFWATSTHNYGIVYEFKPINYINVTELLQARNFKERYPGQFEILIPGAVSSGEVHSATLYNKNDVVKTVVQGG